MKDYVHAVETQVLLPKNRVDCISQIKGAFASCERPADDFLTSWAGLDGPYVLKNWGNLTREQVEDIDLFHSGLGEDLSYMSSPAIRYFLPGVMILFLRKPDAVEAFCNVIQRLEGIFGCRSRSKRHPNEVASYRPVAFSLQQRHAIYNWCSQVMTIIKKFCLDWEEAEYRDRLRRLRKTIHVGSPTLDYDAELFA